MSGIFFLILRFLLAAVLFAFLGYVLWTLWKDLKQQGEVLALRRLPPVTVVLADNSRLRFSTPEVLIGRDPACEVVLDDLTVSTNHARLTYHHSQWWLEDMHSTNGTTLNGEPVEAPQVVTDGDSVHCGQVEFTLALALEQEAAQPNFKGDEHG
jgi:pSer/pThr/pTyr-binding forkhead associated (FHA) protein